MTDTSLDKVINKALANNLFDFATSHLVDQADQMFFIRPGSVG